jgi:hypothetical protein
MWEWLHQPANLENWQVIGIGVLPLIWVGPFALANKRRIKLPM